MKHLTEIDCALIIKERGKKHPVYFFDNSGVDYSRILFYLEIAEMYRVFSVPVKQPGQCNIGDKGDYLCYNPTKGGFYFAMPHDHFKKYFATPKFKDKIISLLTGK